MLDCVINLTLFCRVFDVRSGACFPRAHRKPQPSLSRRLLWLSFCAVPAGVTRLRDHHSLLIFDLLQKIEPLRFPFYYIKEKCHQSNTFCRVFDVRYGACFPRAHRKPQPSLSRRLLWLSFCAVPAGVTRLRYHHSLLIFDLLQKIDPLRFHFYYIKEKCHQSNTFFATSLMSATACAFRGHIVSHNRRCRAVCCGFRFVLFPQESLA
ncbi:hypothetical protein ACIP9C_12685, partial [Lysinibacillus sp. NPDC093210]|uniref:hypothetical protein n=1 Tax=Lysinibacillus sp. NPDC093210 TaxID=3364133 RepID=UPI0037FA317C